MSKYYDTELPVTVHVTYGGRHSGKTYREFEKLKTELTELKSDYSLVVAENKKLKSSIQDTYDSANDTCGELQQRIKKLEEENEYLKVFNKTLMNHNGDAARYIQDYCISEKTGRISDPDILEIYKLLSGGGEPVRKKGSEE